MRSFPAVLAIAVVSLALPAAGHGDHPGALRHIAVDQGTLGPGATDRIPIVWFDANRLEAGWAFFVILSVENTSEALDVALESNGTRVMSWSAAPGGTRVLSTMLPETADYTLVLQNPGNATATYGFYFDQSCECAGKVIPTGIPGGIVVFNVDASPGERIVVGVPEPPAVSLHVRAARLADDRARYPDDFVTLAESADGPVHYLAFDAPGRERYYIFLESTAPHPDNDTTAEDRLVVPRIEVERTGAANVLGPAGPRVVVGVAALGVLGLGYAAAVFLRRR